MVQPGHVEQVNMEEIRVWAGCCVSSSVNWETGPKAAPGQGFESTRTGAGGGRRGLSV